MSSNIPQARRRLTALFGRADTPPAIKAEIAAILPLMERTRTKARTAPREGRSVDAKTAEGIRRMAAQYPLASIQTLANKFNCNPGRVSEALAGLR
jgi:hypothetical protein